MIRAALFVALTIAPAYALPLTCSTWQAVRTCSSPDGYVSHETTWNGLTSGSDNRGASWTTSTWQDQEIITVTPRPER